MQQTRRQTGEMRRRIEVVIRVRGVRYQNVMAFHLQRHVWFKHIYLSSIVKQVLAT
jgi:hypothetical protein